MGLEDVLQYKAVKKAVLSAAFCCVVFLSVGFFAFDDHLFQLRPSPVVVAVLTLLVQAFYALPAAVDLLLVLFQVLHYKPVDLLLVVFQVLLVFVPPVDLLVLWPLLVPMYYKPKTAPEVLTVQVQVQVQVVVQVQVQVQTQYLFVSYQPKSLTALMHYQPTLSV